MLAEHLELTMDQPLGDLPRVLIVDDESAVLNALKRNLSGLFDVHTATNAYSALGMIDTSDTFAVIMADMRMPGLDGAGFLETAMSRAPTSVRLMLSGDLRPQSMIAAINRGRVFRFLEKPCEREVLIEALQAAVVEHDRAKERDRAAADIFSGVNHELRTPLNHIIGFATVLETEQHAPDAIAQYAGAIRESGHSLLSMTDNLVTLAALREGRLALDARGVPLLMFMNDIRDANQAIARDCGIQFTVEADLDVRAVAVLEPSLVEFALNMLIARVLRYTRRGGEVEVRVDAEDDAWIFAISSRDIKDADPNAGGEAGPCAPSIEGVTGAGFSLSLLRAVAELHDGMVETYETIGGRVTTCLKIPRAGGGEATALN